MTNLSIDKDPVVNEFLSYPSYNKKHFDTYCNLQLYDHSAQGGYWIAIISDREDNRGTSVTNRIDKIIKLMFEKYPMLGRHPEETIIIQHDPPSPGTGIKLFDDHRYTLLRWKRISTAEPLKQATAQNAIFHVEEWVHVNKLDVESLIDKGLLPYILQPNHNISRISEPK